MRTELDAEEHIDESIRYEQLFLGGCYGVALTKRGRTDRHICFTVLCEDDGHWFAKGSSGGGSSFWLADAIEAMQAALEWCKANAEPDMYNGLQFGWKFKK